ncbi:MAG: hypothetical protein R2865_07260 [Deinococcales bacterium]
MPIIIFEPRRFEFSLLLSAFIYALTVVLWLLSLWFVVKMMFNRELSPGSIFKAIGLGYTPHLLGFLSLVPYFGVPISTLLSVWSLLPFF